MKKIEDVFFVHKITSIGTHVFRFIGMNKCFYINPSLETAICISEQGRVMKIWNNIYEFMEDYSSCLFGDDIQKTLQASYLISLDLNTSNISCGKPFALKHLNIFSDEQIKLTTTIVSNQKISLDN